MSKSNDFFGDLSVLVVLLLAISLILVCCFIGVTKFITHERTITIIKTEITAEDNYMIFAEENGKVTTFTLNDSILHLNFNTSDTYGQIVAGETYKIKTQGLRIHLLSEYENIYDIEKIN